MTNRESTDVLIIGAGIVGAACAAACAAAGWSTVVVAEGICQGATAAGMGHLVVMDDSPAQFALTQSGVALWRELLPTLPTNVEFDPCGTLWLAADDEQYAIAERRAQYYRARGVQADLLTPAELLAREPHLTRALTGALHIPGDAVIYQPAATGFLLANAERAGGRLVRGEVVALAANGVTLRDGRQLTARRVVLAGGVRSSLLIPGLGVRPRKGHLIITDRYPGFVRHQLVELGYLASAHGGGDESVAFNIQPRSNGQLLIGSSRQFGTDDPTVEPRLLDLMVRAAERYVPEIAKLNVVRCWTGFRPATADHLPLIGRAANGVWCATGHEGLGITTAPATARLLVELMRGDTPHLDPAPFAADRFLNEPVHA